MRAVRVGPKFTAVRKVSLSAHPNVFSTSSTTLAAWLVYSHELQLRFLRYDPEVKLFHFWDPDHLASEIVGGYHKVDPEANIKKFSRVRDRLMQEKLRLNAALRNKKAVRRG